MGVDAVIRLPANVRVEDVADVIAILAGRKPHQYSIQNSSGVFVEVEGVRVESAKTSPGYAQIYVDGELLPHIQKYRFDQGGIYAFYCFESEDGRRQLIPRSTAFWIAVGKRLVDFFGGTVDYQDCDSRRVNYKAPEKSNRLNHPTDGKPWDIFQLRKLHLAPLTTEELKVADRYAAYKVKDHQS